MNVPLRQREPREECPAFLAFVRRKKCRACGAPPRSEAAHLRMACPLRGKEYTGKAQKPHDRWSNPLCSGCHRTAPDSQEAVGEERFWVRVGVDPFENAANLWAQFCRRTSRSPEQHAEVVRRAASVKRAKVRCEKRKCAPPPDFSFPTDKSTPKMKSANRWPTRGSRPITGRGFR